MEIRIFGPGCMRCKQLEQRTRAAVATLQGGDVTFEIVKVEDIMDIAASGALRTPAMQLDGRFVLQGRVPEVRELTTILAKALAGPAPVR
jgi:small redox-active disulfide protein 2